MVQAIQMLIGWLKYKQKFKDERGNLKEQKDHIYGYKALVSLNAEIGLIPI